MVSMAAVAGCGWAWTSVARAEATPAIVAVCAMNARRVIFPISFVSLQGSASHSNSINRVYTASLRLAIAAWRYPRTEGGDSLGERNRLTDARQRLSVAGGVRIDLTRLEGTNGKPNRPS